MGSHGPLSRPVLTVLEYSGAYAGGLGPLSGPMWAVLGSSGRSRGLCGRSWVALGASAGAILGRSWAFVGGLGPLSGPLLAILDRSWDLCWRSWAVLGRKVAQTQAGRRSGKRIWAEKWPKPEREGSPGGGAGTTLFRVPNPPTYFFFR